MNLNQMLSDLGDDIVERIEPEVKALRREHAEGLDGLRSRVEELESRGHTPGANRPGSDADREHMARFTDWLRSPHSEERKTRLAEFEAKLARKDVSVGSSAGGGYAVPEEISRQIEDLELKMSPVRRLIPPVRIGSSDYKALVNIRGATSGWVGETGTRSATETPLLRERVPTLGEIYAYPATTEWALDDIFFDVGKWLADEVAMAFSIEEGDAVIRGSGSNRPTGMLNTTPVTTADFASPLRAAAAYQYIASDLTPGGQGILPDSLVDLMYTLNAAYRAGASWVMNSNTAAYIRKLKDGNDQYLWAPGLVAGQPSNLLGYPVEIWEQMDDIGANNFPVAFGNFQRGYLLVERTQIRITVDANITTPGYVKYYVRRREGGCVRNGDAIKFLRTI